uniref:Uncharacterized protein n=1 Tax=Triticum urartu TaxID=4572 RepID=A0A8R7TX71_TRIUA
MRFPGCWCSTPARSPGPRGGSRRRPGLPARTTPFPVDCDNDGSCDQAEHLDDSESAEMEVA